MTNNMPCIIGVAQKTYRAKDGDAPEPLLQWEEVCRAAAADTGIGSVDTLLQSVQELNLIYNLSWPYDNAADSLAAKLSLADGERKISGLSGTSP